jgi:putative DNA primase/helicase
MATTNIDSPVARPEEIEHFLELVRPTHLAAISLGGEVSGHFVRSTQAASAWAANRNKRRCNLYWTVNAAREGCGAKPAKSDIKAARFAHVDIDPPKSGGAFDHGSVLGQLRGLQLQPSMIIMSGGGLQAFWWLAASGAELATVETVNRALAALLAGDHCHNIDRLMRVPGTVNWPDERKAAKGRVPVLARLLEFNAGSAYSLDQLARAYPPKKPAAGDTKVGQAAQNVGGKVRRLVDHPAGCDRSRWAFAAACAMARDGHSDDEILAVLLDPQNRAAEHIIEQPEPRRAASRTIEAARKALAAANDPDQELSEDRIALAFAETHGDNLRFCHSSGTWYEWTGTHWRRNETKLAFHYARTVARELSRGAPRFSKAVVASGVERFARSDPTISVTGSVWNPDPMLLGTPGGVVDLRTGKLRAADRQDYITKLTSVVPEAGEPSLWLRFLQTATGGDVELIRFLQQGCGYSLTGDTREHALFFVFGSGGNGKSVYLNTVDAILADYAVTASMDTFVASRSDRHPTDLAMLQGARLVTASETEEGRAWAESRIKQLTGGDAVSARFMRQNFFTYRPEFKLLIVGNHAPVLRNVDEAARRRFNIIPFTHKPLNPDPLLEEKLKSEHGCILQWMIEGCLDWLANGLIRPEVVRAATDDYFDEQDVFGQWFAERCEVGDGKFEAASHLYADWAKFADANGERPGSAKQFGGLMGRRGLRAKNSRCFGQLQKVYQGVAVAPKAVFDID